MARRVACSTVLLLAVSALFAGGWHEQGGGSLLTVSEEWGVERLVIDGSFFDIEYRGGRGPALRIEIYGPPDERPMVEREDGHLLITMPERLRFGSTLRGRIAVHGPATMDISTTNDSGAVTVSGVSGNLITVASHSGRVTIEDVDADLLVYSGSGDVVVTSSSGSKRIETDLGDISIGSSDGSLMLRTAAGRIHLWDTIGDLDVITETGPVDAVGQRLVASGRVETNSGRIEVILANNLDEITFDLQTVSGTIQFDDEYFSESVRIGDGPIEFIGLSESGAQYYR